MDGDRPEPHNSWHLLPDDDEPVDMVELTRDDELLDLLGAGLPIDVQTLSDEVRAVVALLAEWRDNLTWFPDTGVC